ncbi:alanine--tRNA ligase [Candidatus Gottesmanbacteria bacterium]|nr:alanine--tRNA ligase [Candidatus Gottesmanbacteria bacterium]
MKSAEVRRKFIEFFKARGHVEIPSAPLVPENDPTTLFTSSGMQPLVPYLLGEPHPLGTRIVDSQKCFRAQDIDEVGNNRHTTFFEMLGNWSLGDYFKNEQLPWIWEFLTKELGLPKERLYVSVLKGDEESVNIWKGLGVPKEKIFSYGVDKNWWSRAGEPDKMPEGEPGGPDSEVFYEFTQVKHDPKFGKQCHPNCDCGRFMEIANSVFMQYRKLGDGSLEELPKKNVDFGGGLERMTAAVNDNPDVFQTDLFTPLMAALGTSGDVRARRIVTDHIKAAVMMMADGVVPSNKMQGYVLRRLIRRAMVKMQQLGGHVSDEMIHAVVETYGGTEYFKTVGIRFIKQTIAEEDEKFGKTLREGMKNVENVSPFDLYQTYGFPIEVTEELYQEKGLRLDREQFEKEKEKHQELSRTAAAGMFKGGLADKSGATTKLHTATHLLHAALRQILGPHVQQKGSNITAERLRFDFSHPAKLTPEELDKIAVLVNENIKADLQVTIEVMSYDEAIKVGALAFFGERYPEKVKVYTMGAFSREICGGPHVTNTGVLGSFQIIKEESAGSGVRRIYATVA